MLQNESTEQMISRAHRMIGALVLTVNRLENYVEEQDAQLDKMDKALGERRQWAERTKNVMRQLIQSAEKHEGKVLIDENNGFLPSMKMLMDTAPK